MPKIKELNEKRNALITRAEEITAAADKENRDLTEDELKEVEKTKGDVEGIDKQIEAQRAVEGMAKEPTEKEGEDTKEEKTEEDKATEEQETRAFETHLRAQWGVINERAEGDNTPLSQGNNGAVVPLTISKRIIRKLYEISPIAERATKYDINGNFAIPYYAEDGTDHIAVGFQGGEFDEIVANSGKFTTITLGGYVAGALALVSRKMINNVSFDLVGYVVDQIAYAVRRFLENVLLNGSGEIEGQTGTVEGLSGVTLAVTSDYSDAISADELIALQDSVKDMFQDGAIWIMSSKTRTAIRQLKDKMGRYMLQDDISLPWGKNLLGHPVYVSDNMPEMEEGNVAIYYGNMAGLALKFTENLEVQVLREKFATKHSDGVIAWFEFDSKVENAQMISKLIMGDEAAPEPQPVPAETTYTVTYNANGGTGTIDPVEVTAGDSITLDDGSDLTAPEGKEFKGWAKSESAQNPTVTSPFTPTGDVTLYAVYGDE